MRFLDSESIRSYRCRSISKNDGHVKSARETTIRSRQSVFQGFECLQPPLGPLPQGRIFQSELEWLQRLQRKKSERKRAAENQDAGKENLEGKDALKTAIIESIEDSIGYWPKTKRGENCCGRPVFPIISNPKRRKKSRRISAHGRRESRRRNKGNPYGPEKEALIVPLVKQDFGAPYNVTARHAAKTTRGNASAHPVKGVYEHLHVYYYVKKHSKLRSKIRQKNCLVMLFDCRTKTMK